MSRTRIRVCRSDGCPLGGAKNLYQKSDSSLRSERQTLIFSVVFGFANSFRKKMKITLDHFNIIVENMARSVAFYCEILGFKKTFEATLEGE